MSPLARLLGLGSPASHLAGSRWNVLPADEDGWVPLRDAYGSGSPFEAGAEPLHDGVRETLDIVSGW